MNGLATRNYRSQVFFLSFFALIIFCVVALRIVIGPFVLALALAYVFNPFIEALERRGMHRSLIVVSAIIAAVLLFVVGFWFLVPVVFHQFELLVRMLPQVRDYIDTHWLPRLHHLLRESLGSVLRDSKVAQLSDILNLSVGKPSELLLNSIGNSTKFVASWAAASVLAPLFAFFVMRDFRRLMLKLLSLVPPDLRSVFLRFVHDVDHTLRAVLRGQILVISLLSTLYAVAFLLAGLPAGLVVGIITGLARLVPYLDLAVGGTLCFLILVTNAAPAATVVGVVIGFVLIQILDGLFLTPRIMGQFSGLHPFLIILSVLCFGDWFGFYGVLLAIPLAAVGRVALNTLLEAYKESRFFRNSFER